MRSWEALLFLGVALLVHGAGFYVTTPSGENAALGGDAGTAPVTVAAASPEVVSMVNAWETPPDAVAAAPGHLSAPGAPPEAPVVAAAKSTVRERLPLPGTIPLSSRATEGAWPTDAVRPERQFERRDRTPEMEGTVVGPWPAPRPARRRLAPTREAERPEPAQPMADARADLQASGTAAALARNGPGEADLEVASPGSRASLEQVWGGRIQQRLQGVLSYPPQARVRGITGQAMVELRVEPRGRVLSRRLVKSSGSDILDDAAIRTIDRAGSVPPAPEGLSVIGTFQLPMTFRVR